MKTRVVEIDGSFRPGNIIAPMPFDLDQEHYLVVDVAGNVIEVVNVSELFVGNGVYFDPETNLSVFPCENAEEVPL